MLFHVRMDVHLPPDLDPAVRADLIARERTRAIELQQAGVWPGLWRIVGEYANYSIFDVDSNETLHDLLSSLPLFPYLRIQVTPLARHPSKL
jgi:muconolactone D-isomerase